ncbi:MAG TPA: hypothetical protein VNF73_03870 [Candidatus Saccharimonadales bacterium]|nr:hypothetical protein [Candidatus Saccharimonadales bacterium]
MIDGTFYAEHYVGVAPNEGHMNIWSVPYAQQATYGVGCPGTRPAERTVLRGHPAAWLDCPPGSDNDGGHLILEWREGREAYGVSAHGHTAINRRLIMYIAAHLRRLAHHDGRRMPR